MHTIGKNEELGRMVTLYQLCIHLFPISVFVVGDYFGYCNQFPIGMVMEKAIEIKGSQAYVQNYWPILLPLIESGKIDSTFLFTHVMPLEKIAEGYKMFGERQDECVKILLTTRFSDKRLRDMGTTKLGLHAPKEQAK